MKTKNKYKVRFNLNREADKYMKWQIRDPQGEVTHYEPSEVTLVMQKCVLRNNKREATKIFNGEYKRVCAWVECEEVEVVKHRAIRSMKDPKVEYNPRKQPYWVIDGVDSDKAELELIYSVGRELFSSEIFFI